jgi:hypothetical protein
MLIPAKPLAGFTLSSPFDISKEKRLPLVDSKPAARIRMWFVFSLSGALLIAGAYFYAGETHYNLKFDTSERRESRGIWASSTFQRWLFSYATTNMWGHGIERFDPRSPVRGFTDACLSQDPKWPKYNANYNFAYNMKDASSPEAFSNDILAFFTLLSMCGSILLFPSLARRYGRNFIALFFCLIVYCVFFTYWEPFYFEFWIVPSVLVVILGLLLFNLLGEKLSKILRGIGQIPFYACAVFIAFVFITHNMNNYVIPYSEERYTQGISWSSDPAKYEWMFSPSVYKNKIGK